MKREASGRPSSTKRDGSERPSSVKRDGGVENGITTKAAYALLAAARPAAILQALKQPDFAMVAAVGFMGFRLDAQSYANPLVRRRLAEEAVRNADFADKLRQLASEAREPQAVSSKPSQALPAEAHKRTEQPHEPDLLTGKYRAERDRLKEERDAAVAAERDTQRRYGDARADQLAAQTARAKAEQEAERLRERLARAERRYRRLEAENALLSRAAAGAMSINSAAPVHSVSSDRPARPVRDQRKESERRFADAVRHLLDKEKWPLAAQLASDVLRGAPDNPDALGIRAEALIGQGQLREAIADLRRLVSAQIARGETGQAAESLVRLLGLTVRPGSEIKLTRDLFTALSANPSAMENARDAFQRLRTGSPNSYRLLEDSAPAELAKRLFGGGTGAALGPDDPLPLPAGPLHGVTLTARRLIAAIDSNDTSLVDGARAAARALAGEDRALVQAAITAAGEDGSHAQVVFRDTLAGAAIVDASNTAWHGQEMIVGGRPRVGQILAVRRTLRERGFFPVLLIADANLPFVADDTARVRQMARDGELMLSPGGSDADEHILREARRLSAPVITNDFMADWDPEQQVDKVQYDVSLVDGHATLYF